jgi:hypothetical protein
MASLPYASPTPRHLLTLGMFVFGMDSLPYQQLQHTIEWRHGATDRHMARPATQYLGPGTETITLSGLCVPEIAGSFGAFETLRDMGDTGDDYTLIDGQGRVLGEFQIQRLEQEHLSIMAGGLPRHIGFRLELARV